MEKGAEARRLNRRIVRVETIPLDIPLRVPFKIASGSPRRSVEVLLVRVHADDGTTGVGETQAWRRQGSSETLTGLCAVIERHFAPCLLGRSPFELASIMRDLETSIYRSLYAQAAVGDALYDLQGKILGIPVYELLGGRCRGAVPTCWTLTMKDTIEETLEGADEAYAQGYRSFTVKIGLDAGEDVRNVAAVRKRLGDGVVLRVDANASLTFDTALSLLRKLEPYGLDAAEQPLPIWDFDGAAELARRVDIPIMADESVATTHDLMELIKRRSANAIHTKVAKNGGLWGSHRLWTIAEAGGIRIFPGNHPSTSIGTASVLHLAAAWPGPVLDGPFPIGLTVYAEDVVTEPVRMNGPLVPVPARPGWGYELDEEKIGRLRIED